MNIVMDNEIQRLDLVIQGRESGGGCTHVGSSGMLNFTYICSLNDNSDHMVPHFFALVIFRATSLGKPCVTSRDFHGAMSMRPR